MHPARLSYLAIQNAPRRTVVAKDVRTDSTVVTLECGHTTTFVPHCDPRSVTDADCRDCGEQYVRTSPRYAKEFAETPDHA